MIRALEIPDVLGNIVKEQAKKWLGLLLPKVTGAISKHDFNFKFHWFVLIIKRMLMALENMPWINFRWIDLSWSENKILIPN